MLYGDDWTEEFESKGAMLRVRRITPADKAKLEAGLEHMSAQSQYLRFFTAKPHLTRAELEYFTEVDGYNHFAIGVAALRGDGSEGEGVAVGRFVRLTAEPNVAEPAIAVVDDWQRRGIGRRLMLHLISAAAEREVETFRAEFLGVNKQVRHLLEGVSSDAQFEFDGETVRAEFPVAPEGHGMDTFLKLVARRWVELRRYFAGGAGYSPRE